MRALTLFAGIGCSMLGGLLVGHRHVAAVEHDPYRCAVLRARAAEGWFPGLVVHECDVRTFDPAPYAGRVDILCAGWPCQGISRIGNRLGLADDRSGLWSEVERIAGILRPDHLFLENGPDVMALCGDRILGGLARLGYDARYGIVAAANADASHGRPRWWCVADRVRDGMEGIAGGGQRRGQLAEAIAMAYANGIGQLVQQEARLHDPRPFWYDADGCLSAPPWRGDADGWREAARHGCPEPGFRRVGDEAATAVVRARLSAIGDGQDVLAAALAYRLLGGP